MIRTLNCTSRKDITRLVDINPTTDDGFLKVSVKLLPGLEKEIPDFSNFAVFIRCSDKQRAETIKEPKASKLSRESVTFEFHEFGPDHDPKVQVRIVDLETKLIKGATKDKDLPGSGESQGKRSLLSVRKDPQLEHELWRLDWRDAKPVLKYNPSHPSAKQFLLKDDRFTSVVKPAILRAILMHILSLQLHTDGEERQPHAEKWLALCKTMRWNTEPPPAGGNNTYLLTLDWVNKSVEGYARKLKLPTSWKPDDLPA